MTKNVKIAAIVSAAALLAVGASMTSFAATGWQEENGTWTYYNKSGDRVTDTWEKSGSNWFYLNSDGDMATDSLIEDGDNYYYVDANGAMVTNQWVAMDNEDAGDEDQPDVWWYYFQSNGKAYKKGSNSTSLSLKTINGKKYTFNDDGQMQYGWIAKDDGSTNYDDTAWKDCEYYFGDQNDGAMSVGWRQISITDDNSEDAQPGDSFWDEDQDRWFYFKSSGKKQTDSTNKSINGKKYGFDEDGRMIANWYASDVDTASQGSATYSDTFMYFSTPEDGARYTKGWFKVVPGYYLDEDKYNDGSSYWYYADGNGKIYANEIKSIKGKKYAFQEKGRMLSGLVLLQMDGSTTDITQKWDDDGSQPYDTEDNFDDTAAKLSTELTSGDYAFYYFGSDDNEDTDGAMKTGTQTVTIDGDKFSFKFRKDGARKGQGYNGLSEKKYYLGGKLLKASSDDKADLLILDGTLTNPTSMVKQSVTDSIADGTLTKVDAATVNAKFNTSVKDASGSKNYTYYILTTDDTADVHYTRLLNTSGAVVTSGSKKDGDEYKIHVSSSKITYVEVEN